MKTRRQPAMLAIMLISLIATPAFSMLSDNVALSPNGDEVPLQANAPGNPPPPPPYEHDEFQHNKPPSDETEPIGPIKPIYAGRGVLQDANGEEHLIGIVVEEVKVLKPSQIRHFLRENRSLEEIRAEIAKDDEETIYRGYMWIDGVHYKLIDINLNLGEFNTSLEASIIEPQSWMKPDNEKNIAGYIKLETTSMGGDWLGGGELVMCPKQDQSNCNDPDS